MSIQDFSASLKSKAMRDWFQRLSTNNILKIAAKDIRKQEAGAKYNSFYITEETIGDIVKKLTGKDSVSKEEIDAVFTKLKTATYGTKKRSAKTIKEPYISGIGLYFPRVSFTNISTIVNNGFSDYITKDSKISDYFQQGHVYGIFPKKISETAKSLEAGAGGLTKEQKSLMVGILKDLEEELKAEDLASSNLKTNSFNLYASYSKNSSRYLVEMQLKEVNEQAGREQSEISKAIRKYFNPGAVTFTKDGGVQFTEGEGSQKIKRLILDNINKVYGAKGSPSITDLIVEDVLNALTGKKTSKKQYSQKNVSIDKSKSTSIDTSSIKGTIAKELSEVRKARNTLEKLKIQDATIVPTFNLQSYIAARLADQIKRNMGTGYDKKVLNYRSGRLADSASIERVSQSRAGMVSVFYSYMRNPYGTFSTGGAQQDPASRDPKLLISKSIREIGASIIGNRMRAILV